MLSQAGPPASYWPAYGDAAARWRLPDGEWRSGLLTTDNAPGSVGAAARTRVRVWLASSGGPADPPPSQPGLVFGAVALAFGTSCGAGLVLAICYGLARLMLDRRRLAAWDSDWALTGPRWTTRQG